MGNRIETAVVKKPQQVSPNDPAAKIQPRKKHDLI